MISPNECPKVDIDCVVGGDVVRVLNNGILKSGIDFVCEGFKLYPQVGNASCSLTSSNNWTTIQAKDDHSESQLQMTFYIPLFIAIFIIAILIVAAFFIWRKFRKRSHCFSVKGLKKDVGSSSIDLLEARRA